MSENQEQKLKLSPMKDEMVITQMNSPYQAYIPVDMEELQVKFDTYWDKNYQFLIDQYPVKTKGYKKGDISLKKKFLEKAVKPGKLYKSVIVEEFINNIESRSGNVLCIEHVNLIQSEVADALVGVFYYEPVLDVTEELDFNVTRVGERDWDKYWDNKCEYFKDKHKDLIPYEGDDIKEDSNVLLDIMASVDGKPDDELSCRLKWFQMDRMKIQSLKDKLLQSKKGDLFELEYDVEGKGIVKAQIKIHELQTVVYAKLNDDLAMKMGKFTFEEIEKEDREKYVSHMEYIDKSSVADHVINDILYKSVIPPIPVSYIHSEAEYNMQNYIKNSGKDTAVKQFDTEEAMSNHFRTQVQQEILKRMALRWYAKKYNVDFNNKDALVADMMGRVIWREDA